MKNKIKNLIIVIEFVSILFIALIANIIKQDEQISIIERRKLASVPKLTAESIFSGKASKEFENYTTDQFIGRNIFREIKYAFSKNILLQQDDNKLFVKDGAIYKMEYPLKESAVQKSAQKIRYVCDTYLQGMNIYYSIIPDKNYYLKDSHLKIDCSEVEKIMASELQELKYIDIKNLLNVESFYRTDLHWKQEKITNVADVIKEKLGLQESDIKYEEVEAGNFFGTYYGQVSTKIDADTIKYLTNDIIEACETYNVETNKKGKVYDLDRFKTAPDKYDIFLSGATPIIEIENPKTESKKELIIFRDSFGSSLAPLMLDGYKKITLIDIRYVNSSILGDYVKFDNQDVLFIYSVTVLNQNILK